MKVFNILDKKTDIWGKKLLEASAGTGKTFAIEHLFIRLLLEKDDFNIEEILVVTFTKGATKELKFRIRNNLETAIKILKGKIFESQKTFDYLTEFIGQKNKISKIEDALDLFETSCIFTIHSFCFKSLKEFAMDADVLIDSEEIRSNFLKKIILDFFKYSIDDKKYAPEQIEILVNQNKDIDRLAQKLIQQNQSFRNPDLKKITELFEIFKKTLKTFESINLDDEIESFVKISKNFKKLKQKNDDFISQLKKLIETINKKECSIDGFRYFIKSKLSIFEFLDEKNKKIKAKDFLISPFLQKTKEKLYPIIKDATDSKLLFYRLSIDIQEEINDFLEKNEKLTFDKILQKMQKACKNENFIKKLKNRYKAVIIDEFQDTDPIQFDIFETLFLTNENIKAFYLIGDPKQSIYSFRKADLYTYLEATKKVDEISYLDTNFRSTKSLIDSLNALLGSDFSKDWLKLPKINDSLKYLPVKSGLNKSFDFKDDIAPIHFCISEGDRVKKWPTDEMEHKFFTFITNEIIRLKKNHNFSNSSFAVLVKDRYQGERLKTYLQRYAIKAKTTRASSLKNSITLKAMEEFFEACINPNNLNKVKIALLGPFIQIPLNVLKNLEFSKYLEKFHFLKSILNKKNLGIFFHHFFKISFNNTTILENIASKNFLSFYLDTVSLIEKILSEKKLSSHSILSFFEKLKNLDEVDEMLKNEQNFDDGVNILTTFMSKGLEYDIVFALDLASKGKGSVLEDLKEIDAEKMRQFYVAITRAKFRVYLPIAIDLKEKPILDGTYSIMEYYLSHILESLNVIQKNELLNKLDLLKDKNFISYSFVDSIKKPLLDKKIEKTIIVEPQKFISKFDARYIHSFSSLNSYAVLKTEDKKQIPNIPIGPEIGDIFHQILENIFKKKSFETKIIKKIIKDFIEDTEIENFEKNVFQIIENTLLAPLLKDNSFCLKDVSFDNFYPEVEFLFSWKNDYMKGFIDLVFAYENKYYIIDWKSNYLGDFKEDYENQSLEKEMKKHNYYLQAAIYTKSLKRHLKILNKDFERVFGGAFYIFLRGLSNTKPNLSYLNESRFNEPETLGIYHFFPDLKIVEETYKKSVINAR